MAVASNPLETFIWGAGGQKMSPEQVARQREIAAALMQGGMDYSPVDHWLQGAARASQGLVGGLKDRWAGEAEQRGRDAYQSQWDSIFPSGGASPVAAALTGGSSDMGIPISESSGATVPTASIPSAEYSSSYDPASFDWSRYAIGGAASRPDSFTGLDQNYAARIADLVTAADAELGPGALRITSAYRSPELQAELYRDAVAKYGSEEAARKWVAPPGRSKHNSGLAVDFANSAGSLLRDPNSPEAQWIANNASRFGLDVPMSWEPWQVELPRNGGASAAAPRTQVAQAGGSPSVAQLLSLAGNEWANPGQSSVVSALLGQAMQQQDPRYQQQLRQGDLDYRRSEIELQALMNPSAPPPVFEGGQWWDTSSGMPTAITQPNVDPTSGMQNYEFLIAQGVAPEEAAARAFSGGVNVSVGGAAPAPAQGYQNIFDENGNLVRQEMVVGGPAWQEAQAAAAAAEAQEGAQIASGIEGAEKTLTSTRNVLDLIDNSGGQPTTGTLSIPFSALSGTPAGRIRSYVSTLQSGVALGAMQRLKEASATGATGFGALSAPELNLLISDIGALDPNNTEPDIFRETIQRIDERAKRVVADIRKNVAPERIDELGLREFLDAIDPPRNQSTPPRFSSQAEFDAAPSGTVFQAPDGSIRVKP